MPMHSNFGDLIRYFTQFLWIRREMSVLRKMLTCPQTFTCINDDEILKELRNRK